MSFCLPKFASEKFLEKLKDGSIDPGKLIDMSSAERRSFFEDFMGAENAKQTNALFESKLLLKNQQQGLINWAKTVSGLSEPARRDIISRVNKMSEVLQPANEARFFEDLAAHKLGVGVTLEEAGNIADFGRIVAEKKQAMLEGGDRMEYGRARIEFANYLNDLKNNAKKFSFNVGEITSKIAGTAKAVKASMDNSAIFRQGWKTIFTDPKIWAKNAVQSFKDIVQTLGGKKVMDEVNAEIVSRPTYDQMLKAKLAIGTIEEAFPTTLPERVPILGRAYKASETAYTAFIYRMRADIFDKYLEIGEKSGIDMTDKTQLEAVGRVINSLTGRGNLGKAEFGADIVNNIFFSPRFLKSQVDFLTAHLVRVPGEAPLTAFARKRAAINLLKVVTGTAAVLAIAKALDPDSVELNPTSSDFGKIRVNDTRFDVSGGMSSVITLAARLITKESKSSITGKVTPLNSGKYGSKTGSDVVFDFFQNKLSPAASVVNDLFIRDADFEGKKPTIAGETQNLLVPLPITNYQELKDNPNSADMLLTMIADALGISTNTYSKKQ